MIPPQHRVVAIDGPAASGKSSVARLLARKLGWLYVNTGAMYRAVTWWALHNHVSPEDAGEIVALVENSGFSWGVNGNGTESSLSIGGVDPSPHLRDVDVNAHVSPVSAISEVRAILIPAQREYLRSSDVVMEGRDIGSVVFPGTPYKFYIDAPPEVRARRRSLEGQEDEIAARDRSDSTRRNSPLVIAEDAHIIDTSHLTVDGVVGEIIGRLKLMGLPIGD